MLQTCALEWISVSGRSPCSSEVHKKVTVVDPWHPDQLLILGHGLATRGGERLQLWELGLIRSTEKERDRWYHTTNSTHRLGKEKKKEKKYQLTTPCHQLFTLSLSGGSGDELESQRFNITTEKVITETQQLWTSAVKTKMWVCINPPNEVVVLKTCWYFKRDI